MRNTKAKALRKKAEELTIGKTDQHTRKLYKRFKAAFKSGLLTMKGSLKQGPISVTIHGVTK